MASDGITLPADINECVTDLHTCSRGEHCVNTVGSFRCYKALTCQPGYALEDGECTGEDSGLRAPPLTCPVCLLACLQPRLKSFQHLGFMPLGRTHR